MKNKMVMINLTLLNSYLKESRLGDILMKRDERFVEVPSEFYFDDCVIESIADILFIWRCLQFWGSRWFPSEIFDFMFLHSELDYEHELFNIIMREEHRDVDVRTLDRMKLLVGKHNDNHLEHSENIYYTFMDKCAKRGYFDMMYWAYQKAFPFTKKTVILAAKNGHFDCMKFAHNYGGELPPSTCLMALLCKGKDNVSCLKYAHKHGGIINPEVVEYACWMDKPNCLEYILSSGVYYNYKACMGIVYYSFPWGSKCGDILTRHYQKWCNDYGVDYSEPVKETKLDLNSFRRQELANFGRQFLKTFF